MVCHQLYDEYGNQVASVNIETLTCSPIIVQYKGKFYKPCMYDLTEPQSAKCIPVQVYDADAGEFWNG
jgi:hypothetical protein